MFDRDYLKEFQEEGTFIIPHLTEKKIEAKRGQDIFQCMD
jgi:hypothetical protein